MKEFKSSTVASFAQGNELAGNITSGTTYGEAAV